ncbi:MAG: PolC-type DNA polymerase III [Myxococcota bacterium]
MPAAWGLPGWVPRRLQRLLERERAARKGRSLEEAVFGVVDLETTGLAEDARILEVGLVVQRGGRTLETFESFVDPGTAIPWSVTRLTGINAQAVAGAPDERGALARLDRVLARHGVEWLVAHNAPFDRRFLERGWRRADVSRPLPPCACSLRLARRLIRAKSHALGSLAVQLQIVPHARHRALGDAETAAALWWELVQRARIEGLHTLEALAPLAFPGRSRPRWRLVAAVDASPGIG